MTRAVVTGATGFIGGRLTRHLLSAGYDVVAIVRATSDVSRLPPEVTVVVDTGKADALVASVSRAEPSVCFHLAGRFVAKHVASDVGPLVRDNVEFGARVAEAVTANGQTTIVVAGTSWQTVRGEAYRPAALYAATKEAQEALLEYYAITRGCRVVTLRLFDTYGPGDTRRKFLGLLLESARTGRRLVATAGEQLVDLVHVDDVVEAFHRASRLPPDDFPYGTLHRWAVSSGSTVRLRDLAALVNEVTGRPVNVEWGGLPYRDCEMFEPWPAGPSLPGWRTEVPLPEGVRALWNELGGG